MGTVCFKVFQCWCSIRAGTADPCQAIILSSQSISRVVVCDRAFHALPAQLLFVLRSRYFTWQVKPTSLQWIGRYLFSEHRQKASILRTMEFFTHLARPWRRKKITLLLLCCLCAQTLANPSINVALKASFNAGPYLLELL